MIKAQIQENIVVNLVVVDPNNVPDWCADWPDATEDAEIGGTYVGKVFIRKPQEVQPEVPDKV